MNYIALMIAREEHNLMVQSLREPHESDFQITERKLANRLLTIIRGLWGRKKDTHQPITQRQRPGW